jgi:hypothetical protein
MLNILMCFEIFYNRIKIYLAFNVEVGMKCNINLLVSFLLVTYFYCTKVFKFCIQLIKTWWKHGGFQNEILKRNWTYFVMFMLKNYHILIWIWIDVLFGPLYHAWTPNWLVPLGTSHLNFLTPIKLWKIIGNI